MKTNAVFGTRRPEGGQGGRLLVSLLVVLASSCIDLVRNNPCDTNGAFDLARCHEAQGVEPGAEGALCRADADCAAHFTCDDGACAFFNTDPVAKADSLSAEEDGGAVELDVLLNDEDADGDALVVVAVSQGRNGIVTIPDDGSAVIYTPLENTNGIDAFTYSIDDGNGGARTGSVTVDVVAQNDEPELRTLSVVVSEDDTVTVQLDVRDPDGDVVNVSADDAAPPLNGAAIVANNALSYTPFPDFSGEDEVNVLVSDGNSTVSRVIDVDVFTRNDAPIAVLFGGGSVADGSGTGSLEAFFDASASFDPDDAQDTLTFEWFVDGSFSGVTGAAPLVPLTAGRHIVTVVVTDPFGAAASAEVEATVLPTRLFVDASVPFSLDGTSWGRAVQTLQEALVLAPQLPTVAEIFVADGTYRAPVPNGFAMVPNVNIVGGFAGGENSIEERDVRANVAVLTGDLFGDDSAGFANRGENAFHVVTAIDLPGSPALDGFTIRGGFARPEGVADSDRGAGVLVKNASPQLLRLTFEDNVAFGLAAPDNDTSGTGAGSVGGIVSAVDSNLLLAFSSFVGNVTSVDVGGALGAVRGAPFVFNVVVMGMTSVNGFDAASFGGGMGFVTSSPTLLGVSFIGNKGTTAGALSGFESTVSVRYSTFVDNQASATAGALKGVFFTQSSVFVNNTGAGVADLGAGPEITLDSCVDGLNGSVLFGGFIAGADGVVGTRDDDYQLSPFSCGANAGVDNVWSAENRDILGRLRIVGGAPDMGAYEAPE